MAVSAYWYGQAILNALKKKYDLSSDTVKVMLCTSSYSVNQDTHDFKDDVTNEVSSSGTGYTTGGKTIANVAMTYDGPTNTIKIDGDDVTWSSSTITARYAVIYVDVSGADGVKPLLGYVDFGADMQSNNGDFTIQWHADGILKAVAA